MAKKSKGTVTIDTFRPYVERALTDPAFRDDLRDAIEAAKELYGPLAKGRGGVAGAASKLSGDKKTQKQLMKAIDEATRAAGTLKGKKKKHHGRNTLLVAGVVAGALYNPWTGSQTRKWIVDKVAGDDDLQPLEGFDVPVVSTNGGADAGEVAEEAAAETKAAVKSSGKKAAGAAAEAADAAEDAAS